MITINRILARLGLSPILLNNIELLLAAIDMLIIAYALYRIIKWTKETRAWSLFKGLLVILIVYMLADIFRLYTIQWIIDNTLSVGIIALIIIFQPEMRKALEQLGKGKIVSSVFNTTAEQDANELSEHSIQEIIQAVFAMAKLKTGALIVVAKQVGVDDLIATGIKIDSVISRQLLVNIFEDKTPLHDGAVIIKDNRISAATCILPLTAVEIGSELGTRHRAAVGASEISDAVIIIVSEETGVASIAKDGKLYRNMSEKDIVSMLAQNKSPTKRKMVLWKGRVHNGKS